MKSIKMLAAIGMVATVSVAQAQHQHLNVGAASQNQNAPLIWANGADFADVNGYVNTMSLSNSGRFAGFYNGNITLTGLAATSDKGGPDPQAAALGSVLQFKMACLSGPAGGNFGFWDVGSTAPSLSLASGQSSTNLWRLSENDGSAGTDPYGHIHGRRFSATKPGIYLLGFTAVDTSTNGTAGGPIHSASVQLRVYFEAGVNIRTVQVKPTGTRINFAAPANFSWQAYASPTAQANAIWVPVGTPVTGDDYFHDVTDIVTGQGARFYRIIGTAIDP
jgi:hypothetical protein